MALIAGESQVDYRYAGWNEASAKESVCQQRALAYYTSCTRDSADLVQKARTVFSLNEKPLRAFEYGKGCFVRGLNCPRMQLENSERADPADGANSSASSCLGRNSTWYGSCSREEPDRRVWVSSRFFDGSQVSERVTGHGCVVTASHCPRMGFIDGETKIDSTDSAHLSLASCQARASAWWGSCTREMQASEVPSVQIRVRYFQHGLRRAKPSIPE